MVQDVYDISNLVGAGDSNITDAEIVEEARGIKNLIMATIESYIWNERNPDADPSVHPAARVDLLLFLYKPTIETMIDPKEEPRAYIGSFASALPLPQCLP
jgi:hypothetical protein